MIDRRLLKEGVSGVVDKVAGKCSCVVDELDLDNSRVKCGWMMVLFASAVK